MIFGELLPIPDRHRQTETSEGPLTKGKVIWNVPDNKRKLEVIYILTGALPNYEYTVGAHFFSAGTDINFGDGKNLGRSRRGADYLSRRRGDRGTVKPI